MKPHVMVMVMVMMMVMMMMMMMMMSSVYFPLTGHGHSSLSADALAKNCGTLREHL